MGEVKGGTGKVELTCVVHNYSMYWVGAPVFNWVCNHCGHP